MKTIALIAAALTFAACARPGVDPATATASAPASQSAAAETAAAEAPKGPQMDTFSIPQDMQTTTSGLKYSVDQQGTGATAFIGQTVSVHYTGWLMDGTKFDSSRDRGSPLEFALGQGRVIKGWEEGIAGMKVGEKRTLVIPPAIGYGARGTGGGLIPPNATLVFKVELVGVQ